MSSVPDSTAVRVALWRAIHVQVDAQPHVLEDEVGLELAAPAAGWRERPDMNPTWTAGFRAAIVARARFVEDLVVEQVARGVQQYVILGAGLDTFAQRRPDIGSMLRMYEVDQPDTSAWKRQRLVELGHGIPDWLALVPVNFEADASWLDQISAAGFDRNRPAVVVSTGVSMYITKRALAATFRQIAALAKGTTFVTTFMLPIATLPADERAATEAAERGARASGTPFISFYMPGDVEALAAENGLRETRHVSPGEITTRYFAGRTDGLRPAQGEQILVATV